MFVDWLSKVFDHPDPRVSLIIVAKTAIIYAFLVLGLRLLGKRELGQMNIYDLVMIVVIGNAVQNAMIDNDNSLMGGIYSAITLLVLNRLLNGVMRRSPKLEKLLVGQPLLIISHGKLLEAKCAIEGVTKEQVIAALREHGLNKIEDAEMAVLEVDGTISVVPANSKVLKGRRHYKALRLP